MIGQLQFQLVSDHLGMDPSGITGFWKITLFLSHLTHELSEQEEATIPLWDQFCTHRHILP